MNLTMQKKLFISWNAVQGEDLLAPGVVGALLRLREVGYRLVLLGRPAPEGPWDLVRLLSGQGVSFDLIVPESECGMKLDGSDAGLGWNPQLFGLIREDIWAHRLDRERSGVVAMGGEARELAKILGLSYYGLAEQGAALCPVYSADDSASLKDWSALVRALLSVRRRGKAVRRTNETDIRIDVDLDGDPGQSEIHTGIGYFDHMLEQLSRHGGMELSIRVLGDLEIDDHHSVEDTGLALGEALRQALGDRRGLARYGFTLPMDETLASCALDLSGRPGFFFKGSFSREKVGELSTEMVPHFFNSLVQTLGATLHISLDGVNAHHQVEGVFKAVAKTLQAAIRETGDQSIPSTKGAL